MSRADRAPRRVLLNARERGFEPGGWPNRETGRWLVVVVAAALAARLLLFAAMASRDGSLFLQPDSLPYWTLAGNIARHGVFSASAAAPFAPEHFRTPGYPLFLAPFSLAGAPPWAVILAQIALSTAVCALVARAAYSLGGGARGPALAAGLLLALDVPSIFLANLLLTETLFTLLVVAATGLLALSLRRRRLLLTAFAGALYGCAALTRPAALALPVWVAAALLFVPPRELRPRAVQVGVLLALFGLLIAPWVVRNTLRFGGPIFSSVAHDNALFVQGGGVVSVAEDVPYREARARLEAEFARSAAAGGDLLERQRAKLARARAILAEHPVIYAGNYLRAIGNMLFRPLRRDVDLVFGATDSPESLQGWGGGGGAAPGLTSFLRGASRAQLAALAFQGAHLALLFGGIGAFLVRRPPAAVPGAIPLVLATCLFLFLIGGAPETYARFRVPVVPFLALLAGLGLAGRPRSFKEAAS